MKLSMTILVICACLVGNTQAQTVTGSGTPGTVPVFTGTSTIGNSQIQQIDDNIGINTDFMVGRLSVFESREAGLEFQQPYAVYGNISSDMNFAAGVRGDASANSGDASGVIGVAYGLGGSGVVGLRTNDDGTGGAGIVGTTNSTSGFSYGARGTANGATGFSIGVFGEAFSPDGFAASFANHAGGNILVGSVGPYSDVKNVFRVDGDGGFSLTAAFDPTAPTLRSQ